LGRKTDRKRAGHRGGKRLERKTKTRSLALLDGGCPFCRGGHFRYTFCYSDIPLVADYEQNSVIAD